MLVSLPRRLALAGIVLPLALIACRSDDVTGNTPALRAKPAFITGAALTVTNTNDAGAGSLRQAIADAVDGDVIGFDASIAGQTILLSSDQLIVDAKRISITGPTANGITLSAGGSSRVMHVLNTSNVTLTNVTVTGGNVGGAFGGGGILNDGILTIDHSTIAGNSANSGSGGAVSSNGTLTVSNSTLSGNSALYGGALYTSTGQLTLINTTVTGNASGQGGGIDGAAAVLRNSIVAGNSGVLDANCHSSVGISLGGVNLSNDDSCGAAGAAMIIADPKLGPLANNGGPTKTHDLADDSPAIDAAAGGCTVTDDQRYVARPQGGACDIGAVEFNNYITASLFVNSSQSVDSKSGVAIVTGSITCSAAAVIPLSVDLSQAQKIRKVHTTVSAIAQTSVNCSSSKSYWSVALAASSGGFVNGSASVNVKTASSQKSVTPASLTVPVSMYWSHK